jgi:hypothetical protein
VLDGPLALISCVSQTAYARCDECIEESTCAIRLAMKDVRDATAAILDGTTLSMINHRAMPEGRSPDDVPTTIAPRLVLLLVLMFGLTSSARAQESIGATTVGSPTGARPIGAATAPPQAKERTILITAWATVLTGAAPDRNEHALLFRPQSNVQPR